MSLKKSDIDARNMAMLGTTEPDWHIFNNFTSIEIHGNKAGFEFLGKKLLEMVEAKPGDDLWLPTDSRVCEMGPPVFILRMAGEKPPKPPSPPEQSYAEQLQAAREILVEKAKSAIHMPPKPSESS